MAKGAFALGPPSIAAYHLIMSAATGQEADFTYCVIIIKRGTLLNAVHCWDITILGKTAMDSRKY